MKNLHCAAFRLPSASRLSLWAVVALSASLMLLLTGSVSAQAVPSASTPRKVHASAQEWVGRDPAQPTFLLTLQTVDLFGCDGYEIGLNAQASLDTIRVELYGIVRPAPQLLCSSARSAALAEVRLPREPARRVVIIVDSTGTADTLDLTVTDETFRLGGRIPTFVVPDERLRLRYPDRSFAASCGPPGPFCDAFFRWLHSHPGVTRHQMPSEGINPWWPDGVGLPPLVFQYATLSALGDVFRCIDAIQDVIGATVGMGVAVVTWTGETRRAWSRRSYSDAGPAPHNLDVPACR